MIKFNAFKKMFGLYAVSLFLPGLAYGHDYGINGQTSIDWHTDQISRTVAIRIVGTSKDGRLLTLDGKSCIQGGSFAFDVKDDYAFDLDEKVAVEVEFYLQEKASTVGVKYEKSGAGKVTKTANIPTYKSGSRFHKQTYILDRARFANRSLFNTDFSIGLGESGVDLFKNPTLINQIITICNVTLKRSHKTPVPKSYGQLALQILDEKGQVVPARVGIYDATGRLPYPSKDAIAVKRLDEKMMVVDLAPGLIPWPAKNPSAFYIDGAYKAKLPTGPYELVISKGPEYRMIHQYFDVKAGQTQALDIKLDHVINMPAKGWYSGDNHIHYVRHDERDDPNLLLFTQAEDLHVANILQMGNIASALWPIYAWDPIISKIDPTYAFVPGQEDPRTSRLGHIMSLNLTQPVRDNDPLHYLNYRKVFEKARALGGVNGYAHGGGRGATLDVPANLVDFIEMMQRGGVRTDYWFDFLNLGYKLAPSAGTDYMFDFTLPGAERSYVRVKEPFTLQGWFDGLKRGETFVTNGPMLEFTVNGKPMGAELHLKSGDKIVIEATASINPDIDYLASLELIEQGEVIKTVKAKNADDTKLTFRYETTAKKGSWYVVRASGRQPRINKLEWFGKGPAKMALSGAVYVYVDGKSFWKPSRVPAIVATLKQDMRKMISLEIKGDTQWWETREPTLRLWNAQKPLLQQRIDKIMPIYDDLIKRAEQEIGKP